jgi:hypothetical protein
LFHIKVLKVNKKGKNNFEFDERLKKIKERVVFTYKLKMGVNNSDLGILEIYNSIYNPFCSVEIVRLELTPTTSQM